MNPDIEDVTQAVVDIFTSQFEGFLAAVDARKPTPLSPQVPANYYFGDRSVVPTMPCLMFTFGETKPEDEEGEWREQVYSLAIDALYQHQDEEILKRIMGRYGAAIDDTLESNQDLNGIAQQIVGIETVYSGNLTSSQYPLFQNCRVQFTVKLATA